MLKPARINPSYLSLNESPSEKEGKCRDIVGGIASGIPLNESPSEKEGKFLSTVTKSAPSRALNESPSEKEGKSAQLEEMKSKLAPSMKVPPKRKGNLAVNSL